MVCHAADLLSPGGATNDLAEVSAEEAPRVDIIRELLDALPPPKNGDAFNSTAPLSKEEFKCRFPPSVVITVYAYSDARPWSSGRSTDSWLPESD